MTFGSCRRSRWAFRASTTGRRTLSLSVSGMTAYLRGIPEELYALFGTGYLGYTAARQWGKIKGVER